jgi:hypothetical protein
MRFTFDDSGNMTDQILMTHIVLTKDSSWATEDPVHVHLMWLRSGWSRSGDLIIVYSPTLIVTSSRSRTWLTEDLHTACCGDIVVGGPSCYLTSKFLSKATSWVPRLAISHPYDLTLKIILTVIIQGVVIRFEGPEAWEEHNENVSKCV